MKCKFLLLFLLSTFTFSCSNSESIIVSTAIPTAVPTPTIIPITPTVTSLIDSAETVQILPKQYIGQLGDYPFLISSDGGKIILKFPTSERNEQTFLSVPILLLGSNQSVNNIEVQLDRASTYYYVDSWAPDGTAFVGGYYDANKFSGGEYCCGEAVAITNFIDGNVQTSTYSWGWNHANRILWSNDSSMLSITFFIDEYNTLIIDRYGKLIRVLETGNKAAFWLGNILYFTAKKGDKIELRTLDLDTLESNLILENLGGTYYVAQNEKLNRVLLTESISEDADIHSTTRKFYVLDLNTKTIKEIATPKSDIKWAYPWKPSQENVALKVAVNWEETNLWIFDWNTQKIKEYGQIKDLFGWYQNIDGFLVTSLDGKQKVIKP